MLHIMLIAVGKIKEKFFREAVDEYAKRLSRYCRLEIAEVADEKTPEDASDAQAAAVKDKEGERILAKIKENDTVVALDIAGKQKSSEAFAEDIGRWQMDGSRLVFVIGGSLGLSQAVLRRADARLSFSPMTFPHQLMRVIFLEQLYRGFRILKGEPYHK